MKISPWLTGYVKVEMCEAIFLPAWISSNSNTIIFPSLFPLREGVTIIIPRASIVSKDRQICTRKSPWEYTEFSMKREESRRHETLPGDSLEGVKNYILFRTSTRPYKSQVTSVTMSFIRWILFLLFAGSTGLWTFLLFEQDLKLSWVVFELFILCLVMDLQRTSPLFEFRS